MLISKFKLLTRSPTHLHNKILIPSKMADNNDAQSVLDYWYNPEKGMKDLFHSLWFGGGPEQDNEQRGKFGPLIERACNGGLKSWEDHSKTALAHILLIDQFCRSVYRGSPKAFDCDHVPLAITEKLLAGEKISHKDLRPMERFFAYLPLQHSENIDDQNISVEVFEKLSEETKGTECHELVNRGLSCARDHREIIRKYGRFPKRNAVLGRVNTPEEEAMLKITLTYFD